MGRHIQTAARLLEIVPSDGASVNARLSRLKMISNLSIKKKLLPHLPGNLVNMCKTFYQQSIFL